jgi:hypothetical protein
MSKSGGCPRRIFRGLSPSHFPVAFSKLSSLLRTADQRGLGVFEATKKLIFDWLQVNGKQFLIRSGFIAQRMLQSGTRAERDCSRPYLLSLSLNPDQNSV